MDEGRTIITPRIAEYLRVVRIPLRLACLTPSGWPLVLSLWYVYKDGAIYCATQESARVVSYLRQNSNCAFEVAADLPPYCGVRGRAQAFIEPSQGPAILAQLIHRYLPNPESPLARDLLNRQDREVAIRLEPRTIYTWDFTERMQSSVPGQPEKPCPP